MVTAQRFDESGALLPSGSIKRYVTENCGVTLKCVEKLLRETG